MCELAKHTRINYPSSGERCNVPLEVVHSDVWGPSKVTSLLGERWYVTFIDGFSRCTWLYLLKHKSEVLSAFKDFYTLVCNQYNANVKVFRSDNGTEYLNGDFDSFLASRGIIHQTTCVNTAQQNGVAERKNRHLLEVARSLMFKMNVPKFLWGEAVKTAAYLINRMPSRILGYKTPVECLSGSNYFIVPPKIFGCTCFVHDYRNAVSKLDPRAVKCIFVGYSPTQKGYRCWSPTERKFFVSMDVTFHEKLPYYPSTGSDVHHIHSKGENSCKETNSGSAVLIPLIDVFKPKSGAEGEEIVIAGDEDGLGDISPHYQNGDVDLDVTPPSNSRAPSCEPTTLDATEGNIDQVLVPEDLSSTRELSSGTAGEDGPGEEGIESLSPPLVDQPIALRKTARQTSVP